MTTKKPAPKPALVVTFRVTLSPDWGSEYVVSAADVKHALVCAFPLVSLDGRAISVETVDS